MTRKRVGIIGAGQLGRMLALAGYPLGIDCRLLDREPDSPGAQVAQFVPGALDDLAALRTLASGVDVVTLEIENVAIEPLEAIARQIAVYPPPSAVAAAQDRLLEKRLFQSLGIPTAAFAAVDDEADIKAAVDELGLPLVLKTRRMGYDGRGQRLADSVAAIERGWSELGRVPSIAERYVRFERELSLIAARGAAGEQVFYPLSENTHREGILATTIAPYPDAALQAQAEDWLTALMSTLDYRGVLAVEFFHTSTGLVANEMAPRVHNSGHWTIEGAETSQFENHLRAVLGLPLGSTAPRGHAAMLNFVGQLPPAASVLGFPGAHLHDYGKSPRPGRKLGHCTIVDGSRKELLQRLKSLRKLASTGAG